MKVATANAPHRLAPHGPYFQRIADKRCVFIAAQEHADGDDWTPNGWRRFRPKEAQSSTLYFDPAWRHPKDKGWFHFEGSHPLRGIVWMDFGDIVLAGTHLGAFKTRNPRAARNFRREEKQAAAWLAEDPRRVLLGDFNAARSRFWTPHLIRAGRWSQPRPSGPHGTKIDYAIANKHGPWKPHTVALVDGSSDHKAVIVNLEK